MGLKYQLKVFIRSSYKIISNKNINLTTKNLLLLDFVRFSFKTFLFRYLRIKFTKETLLNYKFDLDYYPDFVSQFIEIFVDFTYYFPINAKNIIDCGSNIGMSIAFFKIFFPEAKILAFEANPRTYSILRRNMLGNKFKNVNLVNAAVYTKNGKVNFYTYDNSKTQERSIDNSIFNKVGGYKISVKTIDLSKYLNKKIDILKMDIEGAEARVIEKCGAKIINVKNIVMEFHMYQSIKNNNNLSNMLRVLDKSGFNYYINEANGQLLNDIKNHLIIIKAEG